MESFFLGCLLGKTNYYGVFNTFGGISYSSFCELSIPKIDVCWVSKWVYTYLRIKLIPVLV